MTQEMYCSGSGEKNQLDVGTLHYITLHYITLHYITLRYVTILAGESHTNCH